MSRPRGVRELSARQREVEDTPDRWAQGVSERGRRESESGLAGVVRWSGSNQSMWSLRLKSDGRDWLNPAGTFRWLGRVSWCFGLESGSGSAGLD